MQADFEVTLEFRTAYRRGVLLTASHPRGKPALALEINDGQVSELYSNGPTNSGL